MITRNEADTILMAVSDYLISPLAFDARPACQVYEELMQEKFNKVADIVNGMVKKNNAKTVLETEARRPHGSISGDILRQMIENYERNR